jgi:hypothetical protein
MQRPGQGIEAVVIHGTFWTDADDLPSNYDGVRSKPNGEWERKRDCGLESDALGQLDSATSG